MTGTVYQCQYCTRSVTFDAGAWTHVDGDESDHAASPRK